MSSKKSLLLFFIWLLIVYFNISLIACEYYEDAFGFQPDASLVRTYTRFAETENHCSKFHSLASDLKPDDNRVYNLQEQLSFFKGEWEQEMGDYPLMPFDASGLPGNVSPLYAPLKLVNFRVTHVNPVPHWQNVVSLTGVLSIGIVRNESFGYSLRDRFRMVYGSSVLSIFFEGIYVETNENGGERLLCLLGNSSFPFRKLYKDNSDLVRKYQLDYNYRPPLMLDDHVLLVLRYPQTFSLKRRAIYGEMSSFNEKESVKFFDEVHISSNLNQLSRYPYQLNYEVLKSATCKPSKEMSEDGTNKFSAYRFCDILRLFSDRALSIAPSWRSKYRYVYRGNLGPFTPSRQHRGFNWSYDDVRLVMQDIICVPEIKDDNSVTSAKVSAVLRAIPAPLPHRLAVSRTGLSDMTISVEGSWNSTSGQLCMVGCHGVGDPAFDSCESEVSVYFPQAFSIKQRSAIFGSIYSVNGDSYIPITFGAMLSPRLFPSQEYRRYSCSYLSYNYTKISLAREFRDREHASVFTNTMKQYLVKYPAPRIGDLLYLSLKVGDLSRGLKFETYAFPEISQSNHKQYLFVSLHLLSLGPSLCNDPYNFKEGKGLLSTLPENFSYQLLNVSVHLTFRRALYVPIEISYNNISELFLEGLYDQLVGHLYLTGCRKIEVESSDLERGLDCLIEVKIEYASVTFRWLKNPTARISITSQRNRDDPLHFHSIYLQTCMIPYSTHPHVVTFRKKFECILQILMLLAAIATILSQLIYIKKKGNVIPYISLVMLALQILGYSLPLITGSDILLKWRQSASFSPHMFHDFETRSKVLDYILKILAFVALLLTAKLFQRVTTSRNKSRPSKTAKRFPIDKPVVIIILVFHCMGFLIFFLVNGILLQPKINADEMFGVKEENSVLHMLMTQSDDYIFLAQDLFLLPQIISNFLWRSKVKSLSKFYYIGYTVIRVFLRVYNCVRDPVVNPHLEIVDFVGSNEDFLSTFGDIAVAVTMVLAATVVYIQQSTRYQKFGTLKGMPFISKLNDKFLV